MSTNEASQAFDEQALIDAYDPQATIDEIFNWAPPQKRGNYIVVGPEPKFHMSDDAVKMLTVAVIGAGVTIFGLAVGSRPVAYYSAFITGLFGGGAAVDTAFALVNHRSRKKAWESRKERAAQQDADQQ